ncbi:MAG: hypothetical protein ACR2NP_08620, partial [Pirellulaceae bacterium]
MKRILSFTIALGCLVLTCCNSAAQDSAEPASKLNERIERATEYLLAQQGDDDLWHSPNYGNLREGAAVTTFVLYALGDQVPADKSKLQAAVNALLPATRAAGFVSNAGGPDYSNYGSAQLLLAAERLQLDLPDDVRDALIAYLVRAQLDAEEGYG